MTVLVVWSRNMDHLDRQHKHTDARCTLFHVSFNVAVLQKVGLSTIGVVTIDRMTLHAWIQKCQHRM